MSSWIDDLLPGAAPPDLLGCLEEAFADVGGTDSRTVVANAIGLLFQAYDATAGLLAATLRTCADSLSDPGPRPSIDAVMRRVLVEDGPIQNTRRFASADFVVCGQHVRAGDPILVLLASASLDPDASRPGDFSLGSGPHACPGGEMAKAIVSSADPVLIDRGLQGQLSDHDAYLASPNARVPLLEGVSLCCPAAQEGHVP